MIFYILITIFIGNSYFLQQGIAKEEQRVIRVGVFNMEPYGFVNSNGQLDGYYVKVFDIIANKMNVEVEYVLSGAKEWLENLETNQVDILIGCSITEDRLDQFIFNKHSIAIEDFALFTNKNIESRNFENLNGLRFGYIPESSRSDWIFNFLKSLSVEVIPVEGNDYDELLELMSKDKIDLMVDSAYDNNPYKKIYEFVGDQAYLAANKDNQSLLDELDGIIVDCYKEGLIEPLYKSYFDEEQRKLDKKINILLVTLLILIAITFLGYVIPRIKKRLVKRKITKRLMKDRYVLYYQPIYNPLKKEIVGFEALLRLKDKNNNLISPAKFIPEIEKNNMLFDVTIWIMKKVMIDYQDIIKNNNPNNHPLYISLNLSINEILNNQFVEQAITLLKGYKLDQQQICLELVERVGLKDTDQLVANITLLKEAGFKTAIDDFGMEYSNLDVLEKLDADIIKVDKYYVDGIAKHLVKEETILFIKEVAEKIEKNVVLEGIEQKVQDKKIRSFNSKNIFVQGYYYNKPMPLDEIKKILNVS